MAQSLPSLYACKSSRALTDRLGLEADAIPAGGNFYPEEAALSVLARTALDQRPTVAVALGAGPQAVVLAAAAASYGGAVWVIESDQRALSVTEAMLDRAGLTARMLTAELDAYDKHHLWYRRGVIGRLPGKIDLLFVDGPGHFAGRMPRWPAAPELFPRLSPGATVLLDDAGRVKEKKALARWARDFPEWVQSQPMGGVVQLCRAEGVPGGA